EIYFSEEELRKHSKTICEILNISSLFALRNELYSGTVDTINYNINRILEDMSAEGHLDTLERFYNEVKGYEARAKTIRGYSQGDWGYVLAVNTPDTVKLFGAPQDLDKAIERYSCWAYGDNYYYRVKSIDASCGGFLDESLDHIVDEAKLEIDSFIRKQEATA